MVWAIAVGEDHDTVLAFRDSLGLTFPVLEDTDEEVYSNYTLQAAFLYASFPQDWVIGADGRVAYANNRYEPDELIAVIEQELAR